MAWPLVKAAWSTATTATERFVLVALADWADDAGECWPSIAQLEEKTGLADRTIQRAVLRLVADGHLARDERPGKGVLYRVHPQPRDPRHCVGGDTVSGVTEGRGTPDTVSPNTPRHTNKRKGTAGAGAGELVPVVAPAAGVPACLPAGIEPEQWAGFVVMRKAQRKPLTDRAITLLATKLRAIEAAGGGAPGDVLDQSTLNNWQGVFPLREETHGAGNRSGAGGASGRPAGDPILTALDRIRTERQRLQAGAVEREGSLAGGDGGGPGDGP